MLVLIPSMFIMFFPQPLISLLLSIAAGTRLCYSFFNQCRARPVKTIELWALGGAGISLIPACSFQVPGSCAALVYLSTLLSMRFIVSLIVYREDDCEQTFATMQMLNAHLQKSLQQLKAEHEFAMSKCDRGNEDLLRHVFDKRRRLHELERQYSSQMQSLTARLDELNNANRRRLREIEMQREDIQQLIFDLQERFDRLQARLDHATVKCKVGRSIGDREVFRRFEEALRRTEFELDIFSPCMSFKVVRALKPRLKELLSNPSVKIKIRYSTCDQADARNKITQKVAKMLRKEFKRYPNFEMYRDETQAKLFICDEKFVVASSFNVLAFDGAFDDDTCGEYSDDLETLRAYRAEHFDFPHPSSL